MNNLPPARLKVHIKDPSFRSTNAEADVVINEFPPVTTVDVNLSTGGRHVIGCELTLSEALTLASDIENRVHEAQARIAKKQKLLGGDA